MRIALVSAFVLLVNSARPAAAVNVSGPMPTELDARKNEFIYDWSALGSGCRGRLLEPRASDVTLAVEKPRPGAGLRYRILMKPKKFRLDSPVPSDQGRTNLEFARDCAIRIAVNPGFANRISRVEVQSHMDITKAEGLAMQTLAQVTLGMDTVGSQRHEFRPAETLAGKKLPLRLMPGLNSDEKMPETRCGQAKMLGVDLLFYVNRPNESSRASMALSDDLAIVVDLERC